MWLKPDDREWPSATIHQFAAYRILLGLVIAITLGVASAPQTPSEAWLELPRAVRGSVRLVAVLVGLGLALGPFRRVFGAAAFAICAFMALHDHVSWSVAGPLMLHAALVSVPGGIEPWVLFMGWQARDLSEHFSTLAWLVCGATVTVLALHVTPAALSWGLIVGIWAAVATALVIGPRRAVAAGAFAVALPCAFLAGSPVESLLVLLPTALACITEDWLPPKAGGYREPIVFYDGVCGLCQKGVQLILSEDRRGRFQLAALQSSTSQKLLNLPKTDQYDTMIVYEDGSVFERSGAALRIAEILGGFWRLAGLLSWLPSDWLDAAYDYVAENRYDWFGKLNSCFVPTPSQRQRFLD